MLTAWWTGLATWLEASIAVAVAAVCASVAVALLKIDERTDTTLDAQFRLLFPTTDRVVSMVKTTVRYLAVGSVAAGLALLVLHAARPLTSSLFMPGAYVLAEVYRPVLLGSIVAASPLLLALDALRVRGRARYTFFVSYRSTDAALAREISDLLIAAGVRVWFAEYQIGLTRRERFQAAVDSGIRDSQAAIAVTSDEYYASPHCAHELDGLLARVGPAGILEVRARPLTQASAGRSPVPAEQVVPASVSAVLERFEQRARMSVPRSLRSRGFAVTHVGECLGRPVTLDLGDWQRMPDEPLPAFRFGDDLPILVNLTWGEELAPQVRLRETDDDRAMYDELLRYAAGWFPQLEGRVTRERRGAGRVRVVGVHLLFYGGYSQLALTYHNGLFWTRKVSLVARNPVTGQAGEFVFTFGCPLPYGEYLRRTAEMDRFALSLRWE